MKKNLSLSLTGFIQVVLVSLNTAQIAHGKIIGIFVVGFLISLVWSWNIKKIAFSSLRERVYYCTGAAIGSVSGYYIYQILY